MTPISKTLKNVVNFVKPASTWPKMCYIPLINIHSFVLQTKHFHWSSRYSCVGNCLIWKVNLREKTFTLHGWTQMVVFTTVTIAFETDKWMPVGYFISWISFREVSLSKTGSSAVSCIAGVNRKNNLADHIFSWWKLWGPPGLWRYIPAKIQLSHSIFNFRIRCLFAF